MKEIIRESALGQLVRLVTKKTYLKYPEEEPDFKLPEAWVELMNNPDAKGGDGSADPYTTLSARNFQESASASSGISSIASAELGAAPQEKEQQTLNLVPQTSQLRTTISAAASAPLEKVKSIPIVPKKTKDGAILVDWYYTDDPANPHNWTNARRAAVAFIICIYTFVVYTTSAIYTSSTEGIMKQFGVNEVEATLGLSLYVLGYGVGPLVFSPLSEIPKIGRNPVYIVTMFFFLVLSIPTAFAPNFAGLMVLRFLQGFFGSPCLASGGASVGDMYSMLNMPYAMMAWVSAAYCGPALGPLLSGFSVPAMGWRWSLYETIWAAAPVFVIMFLLLPETSTPAILLRRAERIRKLTGNDRFMSQSEIDQRNVNVTRATIDALIKPIEITVKDPAVLFVQIYTAITYGIYYSFFEVFPLVYPVYYGFDLGQTGIVFLCILVSCLMGIAMYSAYLYFYQNPRIIRLGDPVHEERLIPALPAAVGPTIGLFIFAWTARSTVHWIFPTIGITIYGATVFVVMQCVFIYIPLSYPKYAASLFAANDFFRSALACGSVLFAHPLFANLGVARGTSLLGGLSVIGIGGIWALYIYGARLRSLSKFAESDN